MKKYLICAIFHAITTLIFIIGGIVNIVSKGFNGWEDITPIALGITFGSISFMYFKCIEKKNKLQFIVILKRFWHCEQVNL